jgi:large subunit ribosomal protein L17
VKLGRRFGDAAEVAVLELVDYNTGKEETKPTVKPKRARRTPRKKTETAASPATAPAPESQSTVTQASEKEAT